MKEQDLANTRYRFVLEDGSEIEVKGNEEIEYDGETHTTTNLLELYSLKRLVQIHQKNHP